MNMTASQGCELVRNIYLGIRFPGEVDVVVAPPFTALSSVIAATEDTYIGVAAQNMHWEDKGAFTGEISGAFIKDAGAGYVIIGHSERRQYFGETDETVRKKVGSALRHELVPIVCVGETLEQRESGNFTAVIEKQVRGGLDGLTVEEMAGMIVAYEPVWAIGTGMTATSEQAGEVHAVIRSLLESEFGAETGEKTRILYGGSVNPGNSRELLGMSDIDGALVGGASLKPADFIEIIKSAGA